MPESEPERQDAFSSAISSAVAHADELYRHLSGLLAPERAEWLANWSTQPGWAVGYSFVRAGLHHFGGWALLAAEGRYVPCLALFRPMIEADIRGLWLSLIATDKELVEFREGGSRLQFPPFKKMTSLVAGRAQLPEGLLSAGRWETLCDFTHAGVELIQRSFLMEATPQAFAVEMIEAMRKATTAQGFAVYVFVDKMSEALFSALFGARTAKSSWVQYLQTILTEFLKGEDDHKKLVKNLRAKIAAQNDEFGFENELESYEQRQYVDKKWRSKQPRPGQFEE